MAPNHDLDIVKPAPVVDLVIESRTYYSAFYTHNKDDSPDFSRTSLSRRIAKYGRRLGEGDRILDLGTGRQVLEKEYVASRNRIPPFKIVTLDIAKVTRRQLLAEKYGVMHVRGSGTQLPFYDDTFSLLLSNMALDFMPREALLEVYRVLKPCHNALTNLHHPSLIPDDLDELIRQEELLGIHRNGFRKSLNVLLFWKYLRDNAILFQNPDEIYSTFSRFGFRVERVEEMKVPGDTWWEVDLLKPV